MAAEISIILPSFLRKSLKAYALKALIREHGCTLNRIGRSRNWQLKGTTDQLELVINDIAQSDEASWQWLIKKLSSHIEYSTHESLLALAKRNPNITVNELMAKANCTLAQARQIIDELEWLD
ncbi:ribosome recycling factor Rrf [Thalassotalea loyana]|uniref:Ribosome recycling factor Rrf n=1 Tax=Thalassotalea loyana TaxID=280483 RepID=A0ABQ6HBV5_9GAMM|nr:ribosome recycling factor family protein [Thalassotalea loyana]GLX85586.1 ribosome recycling factor Rrf [Thalassotalea loyana]